MNLAYWFVIHVVIYSEVVGRLIFEMTDADFTGIVA